jgi:hypothetical protein
MKPLRTLPVAAAVVVALASQAGAGTPDDGLRTVTLYPQIPVQFLEPTAACAEGVITFTVLDDSGAPAGTVVNCVKTATFDATTNEQVLGIESTVTLENGSVTAQITDTESLDFSTDLHVIHESYAGHVVGGSGRYRHTAGLFMGGGDLRTQYGQAVDVRIAYVYELDD